MKLLGIDKIKNFIAVHADAKVKLETFASMVNGATWKNPLDIRKTFSNASPVGNGHVVFDICKNKYRLDIKVYYDRGIAKVNRIGTHKEYELWTYE